MAIANVTLSNTFDEWRIRHNVITLNINQVQDNTAGLNIVAANTVYALQTLRTGTGNTTAPSVTFNVDVTTGLYQPSSGQIALTTNGVNALTVDQNQDSTFSNNVTVAKNTNTNSLNVGSGSANSITSFEYVTSYSGNGNTVPTSKTTTEYATTLAIVLG